MRAARHPGIEIAAAATTTSITDTAAYVAGSVGPTPNRMLSCDAQAQRERRECPKAGMLSSQSNRKPQILPEHSVPQFSAGVEL